MRAGPLREVVTIQSPATVQDDNGELIPGWTDVATVRASVADLSGREYVAAGGIQNAAQTKLGIRYRADVVPAMRVLHGTVSYNIEAVLRLGRDGLLLMCKRAD